MLNSAQFYAAKDVANTKALQSLVYESNGFKDFKEKANEIVAINNDQWLRVEMDACKRNTIQGEVFRNMEANKDLYPMWVYKTENDGHVRPEHAALEGLVFRIGDPEGDAVHPICDWNCRCSSEPVDDQYLKESGKQVSKGSDYLNEDDPKTGKPYIGEDFRFNPGKQGPMSNDSSYSEVLSSANKLKPEMFQELPITKPPITGLTIDQAKGVMNNLEITDVEKQALKDYTGEKFNQINQFLGGLRKEIPETVKNTMNELSSFLENAPKVSDTTYRGKKGDRVFNEFKTLKKGDIYSEKAFMSTTYDKAIADKFADGNYNKVIMTIKGKNGVLVEKYSDVRTEKEVLFNKGSNYKIESIKTEKKGLFGKILVSLIEI
jgi:SPP1 gp7 family putative phage head morphogenesis protein